jgi:hypothetical protein
MLKLTGHLFLIAIGNRWPVYYVTYHSGKMKTFPYFSQQPLMTYSILLSCLAA